MSQKKYRLQKADNSWWKQNTQLHYDAVLIAVGAHEAVKLNVPGEELTGVLHGVTFMRKVNLHGKIALGRRVAVIGGGNTAVDCARSARYLGAEEVTIIYRRTRDEMPVTAEDVQEAQEEGVRIELLVSPLRVIGNKEGQVEGLECIRNRLIDPDDSGRPRPVHIEGSEFVLSHIKQGAALVLDETSCIRCGLCMRRCPAGAIEMERFEILTPVYY